MRSVRIIVALLLNRLAQVLRGSEDKRFLPREFLEKVLREMPDRLTLEVIGPSLIANFSYFDPTGNGTIYSTSWYPTDGVMPAIYRALLHEGAENNGVIKDPFAILSANHGALAEYIDGDRLKADLDRLYRERAEQLIAEA